MLRRPPATPESWERAAAAFARRFGYRWIQLEGDALVPARPRRPGPLQYGQVEAPAALMALGCELRETNWLIAEIKAEKR